MKKISFRVFDDIRSKKSPQQIDYELTITELTQEELYFCKKRSNDDFSKTILRSGYTETRTVNIVKTNDYYNHPDNKITIDMKHNQYKNKTEIYSKIEQLSDIDDDFVTYLSLGHLGYYIQEMFHLIYYALNRPKNIICRKHFGHNQGPTTNCDIWISENEDLSFNITQIFISPVNLKIDKFDRQIHMSQLDDLENKDAIHSYLSLSHHFWRKPEIVGRMPDFGDSIITESKDNNHAATSDDCYLDWIKTNEITFTNEYSHKIYGFMIGKWIKYVCMEIVKSKLPGILYKMMADNANQCFNTGLIKMIINYLL